MNAISDIECSVRQRLARHTRDIHEALHVDPVLSRLMSPDLTQVEYEGALAVFASVYSAVENERSRLDLFADWSLTEELDALFLDLRECKTPASRLLLEDPAALLGALYTVHGAAFGRSQFARNVARTLPATSAYFVQLKPRKERWRAICAQLDDTGRRERAFHRIADGAKATFALVARVAAQV